MRLALYVNNFEVRFFLLLLLVWRNIWNRKFRIVIRGLWKQQQHNIEQKYAKWKRVECHANKCTDTKRKKRKNKNDLQICLFIHDEEVFSLFNCCARFMTKERKTIAPQSSSLRFIRFDSLVFFCLNAECTIYQMMFKPNNPRKAIMVLRLSVCHICHMRDCTICVCEWKKNNYEISLLQFGLREKTNHYVGHTLVHTDSIQSASISRLLLYSKSPLVSFAVFASSLLCLNLTVQIPKRI